MQRAGHATLPISLTSFVGREQQIAQLKHLLAGTRLLTLTGAGGSGKTRLALQVAAEMSMTGSVTDGVWWVELVSLTNQDLAPRSVANALGVSEMPHESHTETLTNYLRTRELLLILDNCEHLIGAVAKLCERLLTSCPHLKILTTSREALSIGAEQVWLVPPLALPASQQTSTVQRLVEFEAIRLFVDHAQAVKPEFSLTTTNAQAALQVCERLDGIPLAIELAAARVKVLTVEQIAVRLEDRFDLLTTGSRTALPRHQTLRAAIDWSYDLLSPREKILLCRLAVFAGGWTLAAAESVCIGGEIEAPHVLDLLGRLIDKSMVNLQEQRGAARYHFLETIRVYAQDQLQASGEARQVQERHLNFFLQFAEEIYTFPSSAGLYADRSKQDRHGEERENIRTALGWSLGGHDTEKGVRLAAALVWFWDLNGYIAEGVEWLRAALAVSSRVTPKVRAKVLHAAMSLNRDHGNYQEAIDLGEQSVALYRELGDTARLASALGGLARTISYQGNQERAIAINEESLRLFHDMGINEGVAACLFNLASARQLQGDFEASVPFLEESLAIYRELQDADGIHLVLGMLARVYRMRGDFVQATLTYNQVMANSWKTGFTFRLAFGLEFYAVLATLQQQAERAARLWGAAYALREVSGLPRPASQKDYAEYERDTRSQLGERTFAQLYAEGQAMPLEQAVEYAMAAPIPSPDSVPNQSVVPDAAAKRDLEGMTLRERQVVMLVARGKSNREIADQLVLSERTVEKHVGNILSKLDFHSRTQIAAWTHERGWLEHEA